MSFDKFTFAGPVEESECLIGITVSLLNFIPHKLNELCQVLVTSLQSKRLHITLGVSELLVFILHDAIEAR